MENEYQKTIEKVINKAKDEVEWKSRVFVAAWHRALFDNNCLNSTIAIFIYGDCIIHGMVIVDMDHQKVDAFDCNMDLIETWKIK